MNTESIKIAIVGVVVIALAAHFASKENYEIVLGAIALAGIAYAFYSKDTVTMDGV